MFVVSLDLIYMPMTAQQREKEQQSYDGQCLPILPNSNLYKYKVNSSKIFFENQQRHGRWYSSQYRRNQTKNKQAKNTKDTENKHQKGSQKSTIITLNVN